MTRIPGWIIGCAVLSLSMLALVAAALWLHYDDLPQRFPTHYGFMGRADAFGAKTPARVFIPPLLGVITAGFMFFNVWAIARSPRVASPPSALAMLAIVGLLIATLIAFISSAPLFGGAIPGGPWTLLVLTGATLGTVIIGSLKWASEDTSEDTPEECWHLGTFYYNRDDPSLMVAKRRGMGWTMNFAHPLAWVFPIFLILISVAVVMLAFG
jgi:uncharacterized membrane protein